VNTNLGASPAELLGHAQAVLAGRHPVPRQHAARAAALLARRSLEDTVRGLCGEWGIGPRVSMRSCLISIRALGDPVVAGLAGAAWWGLCRACHHHAYELTPAAAEIEHLIGQTRQLMDLSEDGGTVSSTNGRGNGS
jgi:hypothetical protein